MANRTVTSDIKIWYIPINQSTKAFETPIQWYGATSGEIESESESKDINADGGIYYTASGIESTNLTLEFLQMLPEFAEDSLGEYVNSDGAHIRREGALKNGAFAVMSNVFDATAGVQTKQLEFYYNSTPTGFPTVEHATYEEEVTENPFSIELNCVGNENVKDANGVAGVGYSCIVRNQKNATFFDGFPKSILQPTQTVAVFDMKKMDVVPNKEKGDK